MRTFGDTFKSILVDHIWSSLRRSFRWDRANSHKCPHINEKQVSFAQNLIGETHEAAGYGESTPLNADLRTASDYASDNSTVVVNSTALGFEDSTISRGSSFKSSVKTGKSHRKYFKRRCQPLQHSTDSSGSQSQHQSSSSFMNLKLYQTLIGSEVSHLWFYGNNNEKY